MVVYRVRANEGLLERDAELMVIADAIDRAAAGEGGLIVVEAEAGVGKTQLLRAAGDTGEQAGMHVLRARGSDLDRAFAFGVVRQLFEREVAEAPELLAGGAEPAIPVFAAAGGGDARADEGLFSSLQGLHWLVANLAARKPLLLLADDVHWTDSASLRWLVFLAERVEDVGALVIAATRPAEPGADQELLDALMVAPSARVLKPEPLSEDATTTVVRGLLPEAVDAFCAACHRATGGNPFLLGELLDELYAEGVEGAAGDAERVLDFGPERVGRAVRRRLRLLPPEATSIARAVAVLGTATQLDEAAALAQLDRDVAARAADALVAIRVLDAGRTLDFVHPVVRSSVYEQIPPLERQALHSEAAVLLRERGAEAERVAQHLLRLPPGGEPLCTTTLRTAARDAFKRGAVEAATRYLRRALEEPPPEEERGAVLHELGVAEATDRQRDCFDPHLRAAMAATPDTHARAAIALDLSRALASCGDFQPCVEVAEKAVCALGEPDSELSTALEAEMLAIGFHEFASTALLAPRWERRFAQLDAGEELDPAILACLVVATAASRGTAADALALADQVLARSRLDAPNSVLAGALGNGLVYAGAFSRAGSFYDERMATAAKRGSRLTVTWQSIMRADVSLRLGEIRRAEAEARTGLDYFEEGSGDAGLAWGVANVINSLVARGGLDEAEEELARGIGESPLPSFGRALLLLARANLAMERGRAGAALQDALEAGELVKPTISNPACMGWRSPAALALASLERRAEALTLAEEQLADARRFGVPHAEGVSMRTLGLVTGGREAIEPLRESVAVLERGEGRLEHARSMLELGAALRRSGERGEARDVLREALDAGARMGASGLADRAHEELVAAGARPRRDRRLLSGRESLTSSEDRVAALAADGLTNREIAQRQFVTVKAVEWHLRNVYRKLEVSSREELPAALGLAS